MKYRKRPVVIDAVQWTGTNADAVLGFTLGRASVRDESFTRLGSSERVLVIETLEGEMRAEPGDWIICGVKGEFYPCKPDIFALTYEADAIAACLAAEPNEPLKTECCAAVISGDQRFCPRCGYEARIQPASLGDLLAYGEAESASALAGKDRDQYQFWQGWNAALQQVTTACLAAEQPSEAPNLNQWTCFHCGETFTTSGGARDHFGATEGADAGCLVDRVALEEGGKPERGRGLLMALRKAEDRIAELVRELDHVENDARLWHESEGERKRLQKGHDKSWFMYLDSLEGERLVLAERVKELEACLAAEGADEPLSLKRKDTPENRAFWEHVERTAAEWRASMPEWAKRLAAEGEEEPQP